MKDFGFNGQKRDGSAAHMTDEELKALIKAITDIAKRKKKGSIFVIEEATTEEDEKADTESSIVTLYGNGISPERIHKCFHDSLPVMGGHEEKEVTAKVFKGSVNDLMEMLKRDIEKSKRERGDGK